MNIKPICWAIVLVIVGVNISQAQGLFPSKDGDPDGNKWAWGKKDGTEENAKGLMGGKSLFGEKKTTFPKPFTLSDGDNDGGKLNWGKPAWMKERDPNEPTVLEKMNQNTKNFFQNGKQSMSGWKSKTGSTVRGANSSVRESSSQTWDSITKGVPGWMKGKKDEAEQLQPPPRSANKWFGSGSESKYK
ncbi:MAG: hypothetical protein ABL888_13860 [Pirellulaceae bacterium]